MDQFPRNKSKKGNNKDKETEHKIKSQDEDWKGNKRRDFEGRNTRK